LTLCWRWSRLLAFHRPSCSLTRAFFSARCRVGCLLTISLLSSLPPHGRHASRATLHCCAPRLGRTTDLADQHQGQRTSTPTPRPRAQPQPCTTHALSPTSHHIHVSLPLTLVCACPSPCRSSRPCAGRPRATGTVRVLTAGATPSTGVCFPLWSALPKKSPGHTRQRSPLGSVWCMPPLCPLHYPTQLPSSSVITIRRHLCSSCTHWCWCYLLGFRLTPVAQGHRTDVSFVLPQRLRLSPALFAPPYPLLFAPHHSCFSAVGRR